MELVVHLVEHALEDTLPLVPFLFVTYLALEALEHAAGSRATALVRRAGAAGPVVGALLGIIPQCGFSAMAATLYAGRVITLGTLVSVFLSTSDEMLPLLVAEHVDPGRLAAILLCKALVALITGVVIDALLRLVKRNARLHAAARRLTARRAGEPDLVDEMAEAGEGVEHIHRLCEQDRCGCDDVDEGHGHGSADAHGAGHAHDAAHGCACGHDHGHSHGHGGAASIVRSALSHTIQVTAFIFVTTLILVVVLETVGEDALATLLSANKGLAVFAAALVGLVPNCAASVVVTQLYLEGVLGFGPLMAGTLVAAGVGFLVLFRANRNVRENLVILAMLFAAGVLWGLFFSIV
ncbi:putative manganese transporter [[Collinsella] massiliensis]|uniref:Arsenic efflux protein n=1 Tax=[Collinsella] massiliensis TaxID=1232426 RepID=A0A1Y3XSK0_9ACTN|nr:putative manganese transporter [[Collinsella] massiliensis]OUN88494.1 hypothetical protein B5G02_06150 [[Collinsella] massiliensis]